MMLTTTISSIYATMMSAGAKFMAMLAIKTKLAWASLSYGWLATKTAWMAGMFGLSHPILVSAVSWVTLIAMVCGATVVVLALAKGAIGLIKVFMYGLKKIRAIWMKKNEVTDIPDTPGLDDLATA